MPDVSLFDITKAAQSYSQIAGTLAGFVFAVLILLIERLADAPLRRRRSSSDKYIKEALSFLLVTFVANLVSAILWSLVSGETNPSTNRPRILSLIATLNFALATPLTIQGIIFVVRAMRIKPTITIFRAVFFTSVFIGIFYVFITNMGLISTQIKNSSNTLNYSGSNIVALVVSIMLFPVIAYIINASNSRLFYGYIHDQAFTLFVILWVVCILISTILYGWHALQAPNYNLSNTTMITINYVWSILMAYAITFVPIKSSNLRSGRP
jgi:MFS family permease